MKTWRSILSMSFSILVVLSSSSFMVGFHLCSGEIQNMALFSKADACPMEKQLPPCHRQEKSCCDDEVVIHEAQDFKNTSSEIDFHSQLVSESGITPVVISEVISKESGKFNSAHYQPPLQTHDLTVSHQVFRI